MTEDLINSIRAAVADGASAEARAAGIAACRTLLNALDAKPGEPLGPTATTPTSPIAAMAMALRGVPPDQLLDLLIAKLRSIVPANAHPASRGIHIPLARIPSP